VHALRIYYDPPSCSPRRYFQAAQGLVKGAVKGAITAALNAKALGVPSCFTSSVPARLVGGESLARRRLRSLLRKGARGLPVALFRRVLRRWSVLALTLITMAGRLRRVAAYGSAVGFHLSRGGDLGTSSYYTWCRWVTPVAGAVGFPIAGRC
jgi:hypothetical protein